MLVRAFDRCCAMPLREEYTAAAPGSVVLLLPANSSKCDEFDPFLRGTERRLKLNSGGVLTDENSGRALIASVPNRATADSHDPRRLGGHAVYSLAGLLIIVQCGPLRVGRPDKWTSINPSSRPHPGSEAHHLNAGLN